MIVKNEEALLHQCLSSITPFIDELIVVDTGSTDSTVAITASFGATVYHHPWENDFSLHRNQSISYSRGEWIFIIDADEKVNGTFHPSRLLRIPPSVGALAVTVREISNNTEWMGVRFFRRATFNGYHSAVHNKASYTGMCAGTDLVITHYGYSLPTGKLLQKQARTEAMLLERLAKDSDDFIAEYYLVQILVVQGRCEEAVTRAIRCFTLYSSHYNGDPESMQYLFGLYYMTAVAYMKMRDGTNAYRWAAKGISIRPDDIDLLYIMTRIGYESKNDTLLHEYAERYLAQYDALSSDPFASTSFANPFDGGQFARNVTVFNHNPHAREHVLNLINRGFPPITPR